MAQLLADFADQSSVTGDSCIPYGHRELSLDFFLVQSCGPLRIFPQVLDFASWSGRGDPPRQAIKSYDPVQLQCPIIFSQ